MLYYNPINTWLMEHCLICGSINHVFIYDDDCYAWECWHCGNKWWIDDLAEDSYIITNDIDEERAQLDLTHKVKCAYGHYEREN